MISGITHGNLWVLDQDAALAFYTEKLGFEVRSDQRLDEFGGVRWLTVGVKGRPDIELVLSRPGPPMNDEETAAQIRALLLEGALSGGVLSTADCRTTYEELSGKGVVFLQEPAERPYGIEAVFRDDSGNWFSLTERRAP